MIFLKLFHLLSVVLWVGGMFFAYVVLRPAAVETLQPPERLRLWDAVFRRFLHWVWGAVVVLLVSGMVMIRFFGGVANSPTFVQAMLVLGTLMVAVFALVYFTGYRKLKALVAAQQWPEAGKVLGKIRQLVALNLALSIVTLCAVALGRAGYF
ncbi:MAG: CopD family protein [Nitrosomonadales bacterium]|nr:CopD family protein [Nitrosomonadales bacterium]